jgi:hypothetical protein
VASCSRKSFSEVIEAVSFESLPVLFYFRDEVQGDNPWRQEKYR